MDVSASNASKGLRVQIRISSAHIRGGGSSPRINLGYWKSKARGLDEEKGHQEQQALFFSVCGCEESGRALLWRSRGWKITFG